MNMILTVLNNKGGVGKTTTAVNLAAALASARRRILLIDLDAQGSASLSLGLDREELAPGTAEVLLEGMDMRQGIHQTAVDGLDVLPGAMALGNADLVLGDASGRERRLEGALRPIQEEYGFIVVDCPPSLSLLPINALVAADAYIVPVEPHYLALEGLVNLMEAVERVQEGIGTHARLMGLVLTKVDYRTRANREIAQIIRDHYKQEVFRTEIPINIRLAEAPSFGTTIFDYDAESTGAEGYRALAREVLRRAGRKG